MNQQLELRIGRGQIAIEDGQAVLQLQVEDVGGPYLLPYIQSSRDLELGTTFENSPVTRVHVTLHRGQAQVWEGELNHSYPAVTALGLPYGEYTLEAQAYGDDGRQLQGLRVGRIGIGTVIAALGDSITEGYYGECFVQSPPLHAGQFPKDAVSRDGRNFPQWGPTTHKHMQQSSCMKSWMTDLNDRLSGQLDRPVFIANEGWGGIRTNGYRKLMREDELWARRMELLSPSLWLIHLGVNDERGKRSPADVGSDMEAILDHLVQSFGARGGNIMLARPCYDYADGAAEILRSYCEVYDQLIADRRLLRGPDFFDAYSREKDRYYGSDPVHPNPQGMCLMASLWADAILSQRTAWDAQG